MLKPLQDFLTEIGPAVSNLNTIVVGLDAVEHGHPKPVGLDISWGPADLTAAARKARKFAIEATLVRVSEALNQHFIAVAKLRRFENVRTRWDGDTSIAEKVADIATELLGDDYLVSAAALLVHWRNRVVHGSSKAELRHEQKQLLRANKEKISEKYKGLDVNRLLDDFGTGQPTLKDVSSLIAMAINLAKRIDERLPSELTKDDLDCWLEHYGIKPVIAKVSAETVYHKCEQAIERVFRALAPSLFAPYSRYYPFKRVIDKKSIFPDMK